MKKVYFADRNRAVDRTAPYHLYKDISLENGKPFIEKDAFHFQMTESIAYRMISEFNWRNRSFKYVFITYNLNDTIPVLSEKITMDFYDSVLTK